MSFKQLQYAEKRMHRLWRDMVVAGERGASPIELERLYDAYLQALQSYLRYYEIYRQQSGGIDIHRCA
ncbi:hypothetical protein [Thermogemmatispora tikiterensis]|uniref:Uncharacterized protein n=1 Tax=Thermogemmatispora tikiterensis TaxID=1825093 RepID=A0A328VJC1_9CHLR|nr:hypothetical protein [Thermogemmatispora tikiterensis]RAQ96262.1 hypothetical protein A4R35_12020 [Thermogemmatispora tikiterensis]